MAKGPDTRASIWDNSDEEIIVTEEQEGYSSWTIAAMKEELRERGMRVSGSHAELVERLKDDFTPDDSSEEEEEEETESKDYSAWYDSALEATHALASAISELASAISGLPENPAVPAPQAKTSAPAAATPTNRDTIREITRRLLTAQPNGRERALRVLSEFGGSVSSVPEDELGACLEALEGELEQLGA